MPDAPTALGRRATISEFVRHAIANGSTPLLAHANEARSSDDPEHVHQARVAVRRLRSDLKTCEPLLDTTVTSPLRDELRWLGGVFGAVRDLDVMIAQLGTAIPDDPRQAAAARRLLAAWTAERGRRLTELRATLAGQRYASLTESVFAAGKTPPLLADVDPQYRASAVAEHLAERAFRRARRTAGQLRDAAEVSDADLHDLRRKAKRARYAYELIAPLTDNKRARKRARALQRMQDVLGDLQDAVVAQRRLVRVVPATAERLDVFVAGAWSWQYELARRHGHRDWRRVWKRVERTRRPHR